MYPGYEQYWLEQSLLEDDADRSGRGGHPAYEAAPGKDGATLVSNLMNLSLVDELQLMVHPLVLGGGKALFKDVKQRQTLKLIHANPLQSGSQGGRP